MSHWVKCMAAWHSSQPPISSGRDPSLNNKKKNHWGRHDIGRPLAAICKSTGVCVTIPTHAHKEIEEEKRVGGIKGASPACWRLSDYIECLKLCWGKTSFLSDFSMCLHNNSFKRKWLCLNWEFIWWGNKRIVSAASLEAVRILILLMGESGMFLLRF